jgi:hypothetical protein
MNAEVHSIGGVGGKSAVVYSVSAELEVMMNEVVHSVSAELQVRLVYCTSPSTLTSIMFPL